MAKGTSSSNHGITMKVRINGETREVAEPITLGELLTNLKIELIGTAVELNREVVPRASLDKTSLSDGDAIEIVRMTGGG